MPHFGDQCNYPVKVWIILTAEVGLATEGGWWFAHDWSPVIIIIE